MLESSSQPCSENKHWNDQQNSQGGRWSSDPSVIPYAGDDPAGAENPKLVADVVDIK